MKNLLKTFLILVIVSIVASGDCHCQKFKIAENPVMWTYTLEWKKERLFEVHMHCKIDPSWHVYSIMSPDNNGVGPIPTSITNLTKLNVATINGTVMEEDTRVKTEDDKDLGISVKYYEDSMDLYFRVKTFNDSCMFKWQIDYQVCTGYKCLPPIIDIFKVKLINSEAYNMVGIRETPLNLKPH